MKYNKPRCSVESEYGYATKNLRKHSFTIGPLFGITMVGSAIMYRMSPGVWHLTGREILRLAVSRLSTRNSNACLRTQTERKVYRAATSVSKLCVSEGKTMLRLLGNLVVSTLVFAVALWAADPFVGNWKLNTAKSKYKQGQPPKEQTISIAEVGSDLVIGVEITSNAGKSVSSKYKVPARGGDGTVVEASDYDAVTAKRLGERERDTRMSKGAKEVRSVHSTVSRDGKTMTINVMGTDPMGQPIEGILLFEKQ